MSFRERLMRFMSGRYGSDRLNQTLMWFCIGLAALNLIFRTPVLSVIGYAALIVLVFRMFSRDTARRAAENRKFLDAVIEALLTKKTLTQRDIRDIRHAL